jgi:hypothetical protein
MKVAILTASIGGIDEIKGIPKQTIDVDYYAYFDNNLPYPLPNLNNRLKSKYLKIQTHRFLQGYDYYIWIDGRIEIKADVFAEEMIKALGNDDVALFPHPERKTIGKEYEFISGEIKAGNPYLTSRYANQVMEHEMKWVHTGIMWSNPLYSCNVFIRKANPKVDEAFNEWWSRCIEFSNFDQCMFSCTVPYLCKVKALDRMDFRKQFEIGSHIK